MSTLGKSPILMVVVLMGAAKAANAEPAGIVLPEVSITAPYYHPYTSGLGPRASSNNTIKVVRAPTPVPVTWYYDPYTSCSGPYPQGGTGNGPEICRRELHPSTPSR